MTPKKTSFYLLVTLILIFCAACGPASTTAPTPGLPPMFRPRNGGTTSARELGDVVTSDALDDEGCATTSITDFDEDDPVYVVLQGSTFPQGTRLFARLYQDDQAVEDTEELVADQAYSNVCAHFVFSPSARAEVWEPGNYEVEFYVNGNPYDSVAFEIQ